MAHVLLAARHFQGNLLQTHVCAKGCHDLTEEIVGKEKEQTGEGATA